MAAVPSPPSWSTSQPWNCVGCCPGPAVSAIQKHYDNVGLPSSLQVVVAASIDSHYQTLAAEGVVPPNP